MEDCLSLAKTQSTAVTQVKAEATSLSQAQKSDDGGK